MAGDYRILRVSRLFAALAVIWAAFIFYNSFKTGTQSSAMSDPVSGWAEGMFSWLGISVKDGDTITYWIRKAAHFAEFFLLGFLVCMAISCGARRFISHAGSMGFIFLSAGITDEMIQLYIPGRSSEVKDVLFDFAGCAAAFLVVWLIDRKRNRR